MAQVTSEGTAITLKSRNKSTTFKIVSSEYTGDKVSSAQLKVTYVHDKFYQTESEEGELSEVILTSVTKEADVLASKGEEEEVINYESAIESALALLL